MTRRSLFELLAAAGAVLAAGVVGIPAAITGLSPALNGPRRLTWRPVGRLEDFPVGRVRTAPLMTGRGGWPRPVSPQVVFVWRPTPEEVIVFSRACTDLACPLNYDPGSGCYFCPCHGGIFAHDGTVMAGPPSRPMDRYTSRVRDGILEIDLTSIPPAA